MTPNQKLAKIEYWIADRKLWPNALPTNNNGTLIKGMGAIYDLSWRLHSLRLQARRGHI